MTVMEDIEELFPSVLRYAPNTSDFVLIHAIIRSARDLCGRAPLWSKTDRFEITAPTIQGVTTITDASIEKILNAKLDGQTLTPVSTPWLDENFPGWAYPDAEFGSARYVTQLEPDTVTVVPKATGTMDARFVLKPSRDAQTLPGFLVDQYAVEIARGAAGIILTDPNSENPQLGLDHRTWFEQRLDTIAVKALKGQMGAPLRTKPQMF